MNMEQFRKHMDTSRRQGGICYVSIGGQQHVAVGCDSGSDEIICHPSQRFPMADASAVEGREGLAALLTRFEDHKEKV